MNKELDQFYADIIITAVEGGIGYWSRGYEYAWSDEKPEITSITVVQTDEAYEALDYTPAFFEGYGFLDRKVAEGDERLKDVTHFVGLKEIRKAVSKVRGKDEIAYVSDEWRQRIRDAYRDRDAGMIDANDADTLFQIAALGGAIYG